MPNEQREDLVRVYERAVAVDGADTIAIAVGAERSVAFYRAHRQPGSLDVWLERFGMNSREARITSSADLITGDAVAGEQLVQEAGGGSVHGIADEAELSVAQ